MPAALRLMSFVVPRSPLIASWGFLTTAAPQFPLLDARGLSLLEPQGLLRLPRFVVPCVGRAESLLCSREGSSCSIGLVIIQRDPAWFAGSSRCCFPLLLCWLIFHRPLSPIFCRHRGRTLCPTSVHSFGVRGDTDGALLNLNRSTCIYRGRPIVSQYAREIHCPVLRMDLHMSRISLLLGSINKMLRNIK